MLHNLGFFELFINYMLGFIKIDASNCMLVKDACFSYLWLQTGKEMAVVSVYI